MSTTFKQIYSITSVTHSVTALSFDPVSDTIWVGSDQGTVTAYHGTRGIRGVSFPIGGLLSVSKVLAGDNYVRALGMMSNGLGSWAKGGMNKWFFRSSSDLTTFANMPSSTHFVAAASNAPDLVLLNSMTGTVMREVPTASVVTHLQFSHSMLLSGSADGYLRVHDPRTGLSRSDGAEKVVKAHTSAIQGLQTSGNFAFTIGMGERQSRPFPDPLVKIYDLRNMRPLSPIPFSAVPAFIHVLPKRPSSIAIVSNQGLINIVDASNPSTLSEFYQLDHASYLTSFSISPTAAYMAFGDAEGAIHIMTQVNDGGGIPFNGFDGQPAPLADTAAPLPEIKWTDTTPLNSIGLPYYENHLLSAWSPRLVSSTSGGKYPAPTKISPYVLNAVKIVDNIAYATLPKELRGRRNIVSVGPRKGGGRFRSGKSRSEDVESEISVFDLTDNSVPNMYRQVEIQYSKFGVEDFDFGFFNKTDFSGLETHILNSYTNSLVQVMHYCLPIRHLAKSHITTNCLREHCLLCELGFVSRMLEDAHGTNCQASNFCKTVGVLAQESNAIELIDYGRDSSVINYSDKIQTLHRFLIDHLSSEGNSFPHNPHLRKPTTSPLETTASLAPAPITQLMGTDGKNVIACMSCKAIREKEHMTHVVDLTYPRKVSPNDPPVLPDFLQILRTALLRNMSHKATCQTCKQFSTFTSRRYIPSKDLPPILALNACVYSEEAFRIWQDTRNHTFLQPRIQLHGQIEEGDDPEGAIYEIRALVVQITAKEKCSHLAAIIKVPEAEARADLISPWFLFNDFVVQNISEEEALSFPDRWKTPAIVYLERVDMRDALEFSALPNEIDPTILSRNTSISVNRDESLIRHEFLAFEELPKPGMLVAIDAEFVKMQQEETEYRSDGTNKVLRPARLSLARVSVLRGAGLKEGVPFIDDHIHTSEMIVDYLTEFSGIKFGDLDPLHSRHTLTPLKLVYKKLRLLVDRGCIFIGHGLSKDFRIINIYVPPEQVIDTVDLYFLKGRQRRLSLRFLSWFVLNEHIQTDMHDSIEDAHSALNLYKAYERFEDQGIFDQTLEALYKEGKQYNFKPPPLESFSPPLGPGSLMPMPPSNELLGASQTPSPSLFSSNHFPTSNTPVLLNHRSPNLIWRR